MAAYAVDIDSLNPAQREAVLTTEGPLLVLAGAGSGKTRVLTYRIAHMIADLGVRPWQVLAITFTNKAAAEMRERLQALLPDGTRGMWVCTFHAMCVRMLREDADLLGYTGQFTIYDDDDSRRMVRDIMQALGIEDDIENLRYDKVVIATDADVDGLHIRNLLITYFLCFFEQLVLSGHLYVLETPLFRVQKPKEKPVYCYSEAERDSAAAKLGKKAEITRFKGLGEISPKEFGQFIGEEIKLQPVTLENMRNVPELLGFFMGSNTPKRREYIMNNLEVHKYE